MYFGNDIPDHPVIRNLERTGWPDGKEPPQPACPICYTTEIRELYLDSEGDPAGCEACITKKPSDLAPVPGVCPICNAPCDNIYLDRCGVIIGCDECTIPKDAWDQECCFPDGNLD